MQNSLPAVLRFILIDVMIYMENIIVIVRMVRAKRSRG